MVRVDYAEHAFAGPVLLCVNPYQKVAFSVRSPVSGMALHFHANFFCIETHHEAVGCNGVLFNDVYGIPLVKLDTAAAREFARFMAQMKSEGAARGLAHHEVLVSYLKLLLIRATRLKMAQQGEASPVQARRPEVLRQLLALVEQHYQREHRPAAYARMLHVSPKNLAHLVKVHLHKTLTEVVRERVLKHAKWQLLHTLRPIKEIAFEVGFEDEFYFSRLFKRACGCSPVQFRESETAIREGRNLSMSSGQSSIPLPRPSRIA